MTASGGDRDEELGAALRALDVPPPAPDFYTRLLARLQEVADEGERAVVVPLRRRLRPPRLAGAVAAAVIAAVLVTWGLVPGVGRLGPGPAGAVTADEVRANVQDAVSAPRNFEAEATVVRGNGGSEMTERLRFVISSDGDFRLTDLDGRNDRSYDARLGVQRSYSAGAGSGEALAAESRGLAAGPPDPAAEPSAIFREVGALFRSFLGSNADVPVTEETYEGRPVWRLVMPVDRLLPAPPRQAVVAREELDVAVDRATRFPLRTTNRSLRADGSVFFSSEVRLSKVRTDQPLAPDTFRLRFPAGSRPSNTLEHGFERVTLEEVEGIVGYQPLVPAGVPSGFKLSEVAVARQAGNTAGGQNPTSRNVVSLAFQRGFDRFVVTTRATGPDRRAWADPLNTLTGPPTDEPFTLASGELRGGDGHIVTTRVAGTHAWALTNRLVVTVSGDLSGDEMRTVLESL